MAELIERAVAAEHVHRPSVPAREHVRAAGVRRVGVAAHGTDALRFTLAQDGVTTAIVGTTNPDNAKRNLAVAEKGALPDDAVAAIRAAFAKAESASGERWLGLR